MVVFSVKLQFHYFKKNSNIPDIIETFVKITVLFLNLKF